MKRSPLKPKRDKPRRNEGRVQHNRMKPKASSPPTVEEGRHLSRLAAMPCLVCGIEPVTIHHVTASVHGGRVARSHQRTVPLCPRHHQIQHGPRESVEALGHAGFYREYGIDLLAVAEQLWREELSGPASKEEQISGPDER
jgi:hypothetical protein